MRSLPGGTNLPALVSDAPDEEEEEEEEWEEKEGEEKEGEQGGRGRSGKDRMNAIQTSVLPSRTAMRGPHMQRKVPLDPVLVPSPSERLDAIFVLVR